MNNNASRRRGAILENAILDEAWLLLNKMGYSKLTMDDVARAAKTNKNAIYRRWPQKCYLIFAALSRHLPSIELEVSDHGSLREDLIALFNVLNLFEIIRPDDLRDVILDMLSNMTPYDLFNVINNGNGLRESTETIITRANQRKEISLSIDTISEKALNLPAILIINELVLHGRITETNTEDIIDNILLPIYKASK
ncbi:regulatory protein TetR [Clostridium sp. DL-VIII]|uniref:TetR/AcrR family transcriptional regulator n=1 Tax=Clostridium sp. DL-VIII TaxID=641107 RepID=UPI00023AF05F|nr:TetR/AcrR family transcriptional regulator [Clostridium sp. DL-VIII]EHI97515.1 regulatory protein TetR [Clostridium sp. DL-VIII]